MKLRLFALVLAAALALSACGSSSSSSSQPSSEPESVPSTSTPVSGDYPVLVKDGKFVITPVPDVLFTMEYEPAKTAVTGQHVGLEFPSKMDTDWLGDNGFASDYTLYDIKAAEGDQPRSTEQRGTVKISTAPPDLAAQYGTTDPAEQLERMKSSYFTTADVFSGRKKAVVDDFGYELIFAEQGVVESLGWNGFFIEFIDPESATRSMRFFVCNDEMNEKYFSFAADVDLPADDAGMATRYRNTLFSFKPM